MTARWLPDDSELDAVARTLPPAVPAGDAAEQNRTLLLATAATRAQVRRRPVAPYAITGFALAAAAAAAVWVGLRPSEQVAAPAVAKETIKPIGVARFERVTSWPDFVVRLDNGAITVTVATLEAGESFRVKTADAEVEVRDTRFDVGADEGRISSVTIHEGHAKIRVIDQQVILLSAGESWAPTKTAQRDDLIVQPPAPPIQPTPAHRDETIGERPSPPVEPKPATLTKRAPPQHKLESRQVVTTEPPSTAAPRPEPKVPATKPGEAEFRAGMAALRSGDDRAAAVSFASACRIAKNDAIGEDACFWSGAAARRGGDTASARAALSAFLAQFPRSARAPEASALLGWIVYEAGDIDSAEKLFRSAEHDRVPQVRDSAQRGLTAIERKRSESK